MRASTHADYAADSRKMAGKIEIYFDELPTVITEEDVLIDYEVLNELGISKTSPEHALSSNVFNFTLYNQDQKFSPQNTGSPLYGKIKKNVKVIPYCHVGGDDIEWDSLGEFYVADWSVRDDATTVDVEAYDVIYPFIDDDNIARMPIMSGRVELFLRPLLEGYTVSFLGTAADATIPHMFILSRRYDTYNKILNAQGFYSTVNRQNTLNIGKIPFRVSAAVVNDDTQLISAAIPPTFIKQYDDVTLNYFIPSVQSNQKLIDMVDIDIARGDNTFSNVAYATNYIKSIDNGFIESASLATFVSMQANSNDLSFVLNSADAGKGTVSFFGSSLTLSKLEMTGNNKCLAITNEFIQDESAAATRKDKLMSYVNCALPEIELDLRGDPHIFVGDRLTVNSSYYKLNFSGVVTSISYKYEGGFSSHVVLMNTAAIGG